MVKDLTVASMAEIRTLVKAGPALDERAGRAASVREAELTKPTGSLGRLEAVAAWLAAAQRRHPPKIETVLACVFAGNHGIAAAGVSAFPPEVTAQMVKNFAAGGAAINQLCRTLGADLTVTALDLDRPTADFRHAPAMPEAEFVAAFSAGLDAVPDGVDLVCPGEMGIANTTAAAAIALALFGGRAEDWTGPGTGVAGHDLERKTRAVADGVAHHAAAGEDGLEVLRCLGGRELVAIAGAVTAARHRGAAVVLDGYVATAAVAPLTRVFPDALAHCVLGHVSAEPGHRRLSDLLGLRPLLDLDMRLGEASGAVLASAVVRAACACHTGMATFAEAGVSDSG